MRLAGLLVSYFGQLALLMKWMGTSFRETPISQMVGFDAAAGGNQAATPI